MCETFQEWWRWCNCRLDFVSLRRSIKDCGPFRVPILHMATSLIIQGLFSKEDLGERRHVGQMTEQLEVRSQLTKASLRISVSQRIRMGERLKDYRPGWSSQKSIFGDIYKIQKELKCRICFSCIAIAELHFDTFVNSLCHPENPNSFCEAMHD